MLKNKDINKLKKNNTNSSGIVISEDELAISAVQTTKNIFSMLFKCLFTMLVILGIAGSIVLVSVATFILSYKDSQIQALETLALNQSSHVYVENEDGDQEIYMTFHSTENRVWVDFKDIPKNMINAQIAIEDERFWEHDGVDWYATLGSVFKLATGADDVRGGSTITQQLVKNVSNRNEVSLLRKIEEIFCALNLRKQYSPEEILESYLNIVNYGSGSYGIEAASIKYFGKSIQEASIAECAMIAGITQNPYQFSPINNSAKAEEKQRLVLDKMYELEMITRSEYDDAYDESYNMNYKFKQAETGDTEDKDVLDSGETWNWYIETMYYDLRDDLAEKLNISTARASETIYGGGLNIYCAMNPKIQEGVESVVVNGDSILNDSRVEIGFFMMDYDGKVLAVVGSREEKIDNRLFNWATMGQRSPGSSIKPLSVYSLGIESGVITYSSMVEDRPLPNYYGTKPGPTNYDYRYDGFMPVNEALQRSRNATAAQIVNLTGIDASFNYLQDRFHISTLVNPDDRVFSALATGGMNHGVNVNEMAAAFQTFGNGGIYNEPYTYYYVENSLGEIILDNRDNIPQQAMSEVNASIMNKLLQQVVSGPRGTAGRVKIPGLTTFGKTGTTNDALDVWFVGGTPYAVSALWKGYTDRAANQNQTTHLYMWKAITQYMWDNYWKYEEKKEFEFSEDMVMATYCTDSGFLAGPNCSHTETGWYNKYALPRVCNSNSDHLMYESTPTAPSPSPTPTLIPPPVTPTPSPTPSPAPVESPDVAEPTEEPESSGWSFPSFW